MIIDHLFWLMIIGYLYSTIIHFLPSITSSHLFSSHLSSSQFFSPLFTSFHPFSLLLTSSRLFSPLLVSSRLISPLLASSCLFSPLHASLTSHYKKLHLHPHNFSTQTFYSFYLLYFRTIYKKSFHLFGFILWF